LTSNERLAVLCGASGGSVLVSDAEWTSVTTLGVMTLGVMTLGCVVGEVESELSLPQPAVSARQTTKIPMTLFIIIAGIYNWDFYVRVHLPLKAIPSFVGGR
jgi:hypothetical protein